MTTIVRHRDEREVSASYAEFNKLKAKNLKWRRLIESEVEWLRACADNYGGHPADTLRARADMLDRILSV
jgi:hypothetical protein